MQVARQERALAAEAKLVEITKEKRRMFWKRVRQWAGLINSWVVVGVMALFLFLTGIYVGLNVFPSSVACPSEESLCYLLRWGSKIVYPERR